MFEFFDFLVIICLGGIITDFFLKKQKIQVELIKSQIELEQLRHSNYLIETDQMKLELERLQIEQKK